MWWLVGGITEIVIIPISILWSWLVSGIIVVTVLACAAWWWVPKWQMKSITTGDPKARADTEDNFRKTIGQALGGIAVLFGAVAAYLQFTQQQLQFTRKRRGSSWQTTDPRHLLARKHQSRGGVKRLS
jgi:hypothetical protein